MKKLFVVLALTFPLFAGSGLFTKYEAVRQSLLKNSLAGVQKNAAALAANARAAKKTAIAAQADAVAKSPDLAKARAAFATLSETLSKEPGRPAVYYCPMVQKSWLQRKGKVGNPYEPDMATCGALKTE